MNPLQGLIAYYSAQSRPINTAFHPPWGHGLEAVEGNPGIYQPSVQVPEFTTDQLNPMMARWLDAAGARDPGGIRMQAPKGDTGLPESSLPIAQLKGMAIPSSTGGPTVDTGDPNYQAAQRLAKSKYRQEAEANASQYTPNLPPMAQG